MRYAFCALLLVVPAAVSAQAPPQAPPTSYAAAGAADDPPPPPPKREGTAEFAFVGTTGNASTQTFGLSGQVIARPDGWTITNRAAFVRNESEDELTAESFGYLFRAEHVLSPRTSALGEYGYFRDEFAGVDHRNSIMGGVSYKVVHLPVHLLFVDGGLGYLNEQRLSGDDVSTATYGLGAGYRWKISSTSEFTNDFRFTGTFDRSEDWRISQTAAVTARISGIFSLKVSHTIRYSNDPVPGFENTDTTTGVALVATF